MIKTIIFDYAGVLTATQDNYLFAQKYHERFRMTPLELMEITYRNWKEASINKMSPQEFWGVIGNELDIDPDELRELIVETFPLDPRMIDTVRRLKERFTTIMMSNQLEDWLENVIAAHNLHSLFDHFINSYSVGYAKPDRRIFEEAIRRTNSAFNECLFIDDQGKNTAVAQKLGMYAITFKSYEQFLEELDEYIIL